MNTTGISFEEMLRFYNESPADGKVVKIPDYIFNFNKWEFIKLSSELKKEPSSPNRIILKHKSEKELMLAVHVPVVTFLNKEGVWLELDNTRQSILDLPCTDSHLNKLLYPKDSLIVGSHPIVGAARDLDSTIPYKTYHLGYDNPLISKLLNNIGGLPGISRRLSDSFLC